MVKIDMHMHTKYSWDSTNSLENINKRCVKLGITPIITDHNTIEGARKYYEKYKSCIIGEEITTNQGEIVGLFLKEEIKPLQDINETIDKIKAQGGLIYIPHPFDKRRKKVISQEALKSIKKDIIEIFNSRNIDSIANKNALDYANKNNLLKGVGSDAHFIREIGNSFVELEPFNSVKEFILNLKKAKYYTKKSPLYVHAGTKLIKLKNKNPISHC